MYNRRLVPEDFDVPIRLDGVGFHLRMLSVHDVVKDFAAVVESEGRLVGSMGDGSDWPRGLTIEENLIDLAWHHREFTIGHSFAYTVMNDDESRCLGCCYINPGDKAEYDAAAFYWVREREFKLGFDAILGAAFRGFLAAQWPFKTVAYPGRDIAWSNW